MQDGDLRQFFQVLYPSHSGDIRNGKIFVVVKVHEPDRLHQRWVDILLEDKIHDGLGWAWVLLNSEHLNASR